jgi:hypothetical protein
MVFSDLSPAQKHTVVFNSATNEIEHTLSAYGVDTDVDNLGESFFASADYTSIKKFTLFVSFKSFNGLILAIARNSAALIFFDRRSIILSIS